MILVIDKWATIYEIVNENIIILKYNFMLKVMQFTPEFQKSIDDSKLIPFIYLE